MILATMENMQKHYAPGVFAFSLNTWEEYSADPADYWQGLDGALTDSDGFDMFLARRVITALEDDSQS
jgi:hypothetical protein